MRLYRLFLIHVVLSISFASFASLATQPDNQAIATIKIGLTENPPLIIRKPGSPPVGFMVDYMRALEPALPKPIEFIYYDSWDNLLTAGVAREVDVIVLAQKTPSRLAYFDFTKPVITVKNHLITRSDRALPESMSEVNGLTIAALKQSANESFLVEKFSNRVSVYPVNTIQQALQAVVAKEVDAAISSSLRASHYIKEENLANLVIALDTANDYHLAIATRSDQPQLNVNFDDAMNSLSELELNSLKLKWGLVSESNNNWQLLLFESILVSILIILLIMILKKNVKLKLEIKKRQEFEQQLAAITANIQSERNRAQREARTDSLTGANNRRKFDEFLTAEIERFKRNKSPFCLMIIDLDHFKKINDKYGHDVGDQVLIDISQEIQNVIRPYDHFGRVGGEEFAVILPDTQLPEAETIGERILEAALSYRMEGHDKLSLTVSIGLAQVDEPEAKILYKQADQALYASKQNGRNQLTCFNIDLSN